MSRNSSQVAIRTGTCPLEPLARRQYDGSVSSPLRRSYQSNESSVWREMRRPSDRRYDDKPPIRRHHGAGNRRPESDVETSLGLWHGSRSGTATVGNLAQALSRGRGSGMMAACNGGSSSSMVVERHLVSVRSLSLRVLHTPRAHRRMRSSSRSSPGGRQEFRSGSVRRRCPPCRSRSFATAASRGSERSVSRTRLRTNLWTRFAVRRVLLHQAGVRVRRSETVREGPSGSRHAVDRVTKLRITDDPRIDRSPRGMCSVTPPGFPTGGRERNFRSNSTRDRETSTQARDSAICNPWSRR